MNPTPSLRFAGYHEPTHKLSHLPDSKTLVDYIGQNMVLSRFDLRDPEKQLANKVVTIVDVQGHGGQTDDFGYRVDEKYTTPEEGASLDDNVDMVTIQYQEGRKTVTEKMLYGFASKVIANSQPGGPVYDEQDFRNLAEKQDDTQQEPVITPYEGSATKKDDKITPIKQLLIPLEEAVVTLTDALNKSRKVSTAAAELSKRLRAD